MRILLCTYSAGEEHSGVSQGGQVQVHTLRHVLTRHCRQTWDTRMKYLNRASLCRRCSYLLPNESCNSPVRISYWTPRPLQVEPQMATKDQHCTSPPSSVLGLTPVYHQPAVQRLAILKRPHMLRLCLPNLTQLSTMLA